MNSLVDTYKDRYFDPRRGQVVGVNYGPSGQAMESELGLGGGKRMAGSTLGLELTDLTADGNTFLRKLLKLDDIAHGGSTPYKPMDTDSLKKLTTPGSPMPPGMKEEILRQLGEMTRKA